MFDPNPDDFEEDGWQRITADAPIEVDILNSEWLPLPPNTVLQDHYQNWATTLQSGIVDNLRGRSHVEVIEEANQIKMGSTFSDFEEFDQCLDSWCVVNGRSSVHLESKWTFRLRFC